MLEHPDITRALKTGYPEIELDPIGTDFFGHEYFDGENLLVYDVEVFLESELSSDAIEILEHIGADRITAKEVS